MFFDITTKYIFFTVNDYRSFPFSVTICLQYPCNFFSESAMSSVSSSYLTLLIFYPMYLNTMPFTSLIIKILVYILAIVNTIVPLAFPSIRLDQSEVMNELREIKLLCFHFSTFLFQEKTIRKVPRALIPRSDCSFIPRSPLRVLKIANQSNLLSSQDSVDVSGNEVQILFLSANFLNISVV